ncbi:MAG TPA: radical SAM protein, partial [Proteobacteria bacterium]|nr:radical SAM protein [Pseudomonadota bacterium]
LKHFHETKGVKRFIFVDSLINGNMRELEKWLDLVIEDGMRIRWYGFAILRKQMDARIAYKMARAGCVLLQLGIESASPRVRKSMNKSPDMRMVQDVVKAVSDAGIRIQGLFIVGYPTERWTDFAKTLWFIAKNKGRINHIVRPTYPYVVLPSSILFDEREKWGITFPEGQYHLWTDGRSTFEKRMRRLKIFKWWVNLLKISSEIGPEVFEIGRVVKERQKRLAPEDRVFEITGIDGPGEARAGGKARFVVEIRYTGKAMLWDYESAKRHPVGLGYHIYGADGDLVSFDDGTRVYLDRPLAPNDTERFAIEVGAPEDAGEYLVEFALVQDRVGWFSETSGRRARLAVSR